MNHPVANDETIGWKRRITIALRWLAVYLLVIYLTFRFGGGGHPASPGQEWIGS